MRAERARRPEGRARLARSHRAHPQRDGYVASAPDSSSSPPSSTARRTCCTRSSAMPGAHPLSVGVAALPRRGSVEIEDRRRAPGVTLATWTSGRSRTCAGHRAQRHRARVVVGQPARDVRHHQGRTPRARERVRGGRRRLRRPAQPPDARVLLRHRGPRIMEIEGEDARSAKATWCNIPPMAMHSLRPVSDTAPSTASASRCHPRRGSINYTQH